MRVRVNNMEMTAWLEYFVEGLSTQINELESKSTEIIKYDLLEKNGKISADQYLAVEYILEYGAITVKNYKLLCPEVNQTQFAKIVKRIDRFQYNNYRRHYK